MDKQKTKLIANFVGIDFWNRPIFKGMWPGGGYYCLVDKLFDYEEVPLQEDIDGRVVYDIDAPDGDPGFPQKNIELRVVKNG